MTSKKDIERARAAYAARMALTGGQPQQPPAPAKAFSLGAKMQQHADQAGINVYRAATFGRKIGANRRR